MFAPRPLHIDHAWRIVGVAFVISLMSTGTRFAAGPFLASMTESFGLTHTQFSAVVAGSLLIYGLCLPVAGRLSDLFGARRVLAVGGVLLASSLAITASTSSPLVFTLSYSLLASLGSAATSHVALSPLIGRWFVKRRGLAMTFLSAGAMSGIAVMVPLSSALIAQVGWRSTMLLLAGTFLVVVLAGALVVGNGSAQPLMSSMVRGSGGGRTPSWRAAVKTQPFWLLALGFFSCGFSMNLLGTHGISMLESHGFSTMSAAYGIGLIGLVSMGGTLAIGAASDRMGRGRFLALIYGVRAVGFVGLLFAGLDWELYTVAAIGGLVWSGSSALTSAVTADLFGIESLGTLIGLIFLSHQIGAASGSLMGGWSFDTLGTYWLPFGLAAAFLVGSSLLSWQLPSHRERPTGPALASGD